MRKYIQKTFILVFTLASISAMPCECNFIKEVNQAVKSSDYVLSGEVILIEYIQTIEKNGKITEIVKTNSRKDLNMFNGRILAKITFKATEIFKGKKRKKEVIVYTGSSGGGDCGYYFKPNENYIIYAYKDSWYTKELRKKDKAYKKILYTDTCTRTQLQNKKEIKSLRNLK